MIIRTQKNELNIFQAEDRNQENKTGKNKNNDIYRRHRVTKREQPTCQKM